MNLRCIVAVAVGLLIGFSADAHAQSDLGACEALAQAARAEMGEGFLQAHGGNNPGLYQVITASTVDEFWDAYYYYDGGSFYTREWLASPEGMQWLGDEPRLRQRFGNDASGRIVELEVCWARMKLARLRGGSIPSSKATARPAAPPAPPKPAPHAPTAREIWYQAVSDGDVDAVRQLLRSGKATVGMLLDEEKNTAMHLAAERCHDQLVSYLISQGGDRNAINKWNDTPVGIASARCGAGAQTSVVLQTQPDPDEVEPEASAAGSAETTAPAAKSRVIARDGQDAMECVSLKQVAQSNSSTSGGGSVLINNCDDTVTIGWCSTGGECERGAGNVTNLLSLKSWPVDASHEVRWGACHGANTLHGDPGSKGLQYSCSMPEFSP